MYSLLIVEDERLERETLYDIVKNSFPVLHKVWTCDNADAVLELLQSESPDIILMDIHLGNANGIDLSQIILSQLPNVCIIVISAFDQFSYAQKAVKLGIADYLLKPVSTPKLLHAIEQQIQLLDAQRMTLREQIKQENYLTQLKDAFFASFMNGIVRGYLHPYSEDMLRSFHIPTEYMQIFVVKLLAEKYEFSESETAVIKKLAADKIQASFELPVLQDAMSSDEILFCMFYQQEDSGEEQCAIEKIQHILFFEFHIPFQIGISPPVRALTDLTAAYKHALGAIQLSDGLICRYSDYSTELSHTLPFNNPAGRIAELLLKQDRQQLLAEIALLSFSSPKNFQSLSDAKAVVISLWLETVRELDDRLSSKNFSKNDFFIEAVTDFINASNLTALNSSLEKNILSALRITGAQLNEKTNYIAQRAQNFIADHYAESLSLQSISDSLRISPYYLCHVFKHALGMGVMEYLNLCRINASKQMLRNNDANIKTVAYAVGFSDPNYFCRVFKKFLGITPSVYKNSKTSPGP